MNDKELLPLSQHVSRKLRRFSVGLPVLAAIFLSLAFTYVILFLRISSDTQMLNTLSPYVSTLIDSGDRPELMRLLKSLALTHTGKFDVVKTGILTASSSDISALDRPYRQGKVQMRFDGLEIIEGSFVLRTPITLSDRSQNRAQMTFSLPIIDVLAAPLLLGLGLLLAGLMLGRITLLRIARAVNESVSPVSKLDKAIQELKELKDPSSMDSFQIRELENIRHSILETHRTLIKTRDALALSKAQEMTADAYKGLIHDLHNPIAALGNATLVTVENGYTAEDQRQAQVLASEILGEVLNQIQAARTNLEFSIPKLEESDVCKSVDQATDRSQLAMDMKKTVVIRKLFPSGPVVISHDPVLLRRAIGNLISNALEACSSQVEVSIEPVASGVRISVSDDGPGMGIENAGMFLQGRGQSTKHNRPGIGLSSANHIVRSHGGRVVYRASPTGGSCFEIRMEAAL